MFKQLQEQHKEWAFANFGEQETEDYALGMIEEVGELAHAVLKRKQGIRNNENHDDNIKDAIGDIVIYLIGFCNSEDIDLQDSFTSTKHYSYPDYSCVPISLTISNLIENKTKFEVIMLLNVLICFCGSEGIDFEETVLNTWNNVVSKRNWKKNPDCVSLENAKDELEESGFITVESEVNGIDTKINLCVSCSYEYPDCKSGVVIFGNAKGRDNIIKCDHYKERINTDDPRYQGFPV